ncbi:MAG: hypothetical protein ACRD0J_14430 [Acidimicrobiales bacterium]
MSDRRQVLLRVDPSVHDALARWAGDEFRSVNAQVEMLLRRALADAGRMPKKAAPPPRRGRPRAGDERTPPVRPTRAAHGAEQAGGGTRKKLRKAPPGQSPASQRP